MMKPFSCIWISLIFVSWITGSKSSITLTQSESQQVEPSRSITLSCQVEGFDVNSYWMSWIRQLPGKPLEWLAAIGSKSKTEYHSDTIKNRFKASKDFSKHIFFLQMNNLRTDDTAVYYCTRDAYNYWVMDYWGQGTMVTVTSASPTAPTLFPLISTCGSVESSPISIGCLATGFTPSSLQFSWADDKTDLTNFRQFPSVRGNGETYMMSTQLSVATADWDRGANFTCKAKHSAGNREKTLRKPDQTPPMPPTMFIASPSKDEIHKNRTATMVCVAKGFYPKAHTFSWLKNDIPVTSGINNCPEALTPNSKLYHASSMLTVASSEWTQYNNNFTCVLEVNRHKYSASISSDPGCGPVQSVSLEIIPPSPEDMFTSLPNRHGDLSCIASNLNPEDSITFIWRENNDKEVHNETVDPELTDSIYTAKSKYTISFDQWSSRNKYECKVKDHSYIPFPISRTYTRDNDKQFLTPKIAIFPPPTYEAIGTTTTVTLTCFVKDFYPKEIFVTWNDNDSPVDKRDVATTDVIKHNTESNSYSVYSKLTVNSDHWNNGHSYSCIVYHESMGSQSSTLVRTIDISSEYFYDTAEGPEDDYDSLWTTASTFIILFFISLFYSIGATIFKVK